MKPTEYIKDSFDQLKEKKESIQKRVDFYVKSKFSVKNFIIQFKNCFNTFDEEYNFRILNNINIEDPGKKIHYQNINRNLININEQLTVIIHSEDDIAICKEAMFNIVLSLKAISFNLEKSFKKGVAKKQSLKSFFIVFLSVAAISFLFLYIFLTIDFFSFGPPLHGNNLSIKILNLFKDLFFYIEKIDQIALRDACYSVIGIGLFNMSVSAPAYSINHFLKSSEDPNYVYENNLSREISKFDDYKNGTCFF